MSARSDPDDERDADLFIKSWDSSGTEFHQQIPTSCGLALSTWKPMKRLRICSLQWEVHEVLEITAR